MEEIVIERWHIREPRTFREKVRQKLGFDESVIRGTSLLAEKIVLLSDEEIAALGERLKGKHVDLVLRVGD